MHFAFDEDQEAVRDAVGSLLAKRCDVAALQSAWSAGSAEPLLPLWEELASVGVAGLLAPESSGGTGLDWVAMALVLAECGRVALPLPVMETAAVTVPAIVSTGAGSAAAALSSLLDGSAVATVISPSGFAPAASIAGLFLEMRPSGVVVHSREEVRIEPVASVDRTRDLARVTVLGDGAARTGPVPVADWCALGTAAQLVGLGRELVRTTVEYVKDRRQFGVPVGSFQAVKHHLADAHKAVEFAAPPVWAAAHLVGREDGATLRPETTRAVSMAKAMASDAATLAARMALQCHGAMGYAAEYHLHFWLKRVWCLAAEHGSSAEHTSRVATALGI